MKTQEETNTKFHEEKSNFRRFVLAPFAILSIAGLSFVTVGLVTSSASAQDGGDGDIGGIIDNGDSVGIDNDSPRKDRYLDGGVSFRDRAVSFHDTLFGRTWDLSYLDGDSTWATCNRQAYDEVYGLDASSPDFTTTAVRTKTDSTQTINDGTDTALATPELNRDFAIALYECHLGELGVDAPRGFSPSKGNFEERAKSTAEHFKNVRTSFALPFSDLSWLDNEDNELVACHNGVYDEVLGIDGTSADLTVTVFRTKTDTTLTIADGVNSVELDEDLATELRSGIKDCHEAEFGNLFMGFRDGNGLRDGHGLGHGHTKGFGIDPADLA